MAGVADLTIVSVADAVAVTVAVDAGEVTADPVGGVPVAVAELAMDPLLMSACVAL